MPRPVSLYERNLLEMTAEEMEPQDVVDLFQLASEMLNRGGVALQRMQSREVRYERKSAWTLSTDAQCDAYRAAQAAKKELTL